MALCALAANWKTEGLNGIGKKDVFIDGLFAVIVDHGLRAVSRDEAILVRNRVSEMGITCEIACCDWPDGTPKRGHLQETAHNMRYQIFQDLCMRNQIRVLLKAHHADDQVVTIVNQGYAAIDLKVLTASQIEDIFLKISCLGLTELPHCSWLLHFSCSWSKDTKVLVCCFVDCPLPSKSELFYMHSKEENKGCDLNELEHIIANGKSYCDKLVPDASVVLFLQLGSASVLDEARRLDILSVSSHKNILLLQLEEVGHFRSKTDVNFDHEAQDEVENTSESPSEPLQPGQTCYFMNRFLITWKPSKEISSNPYLGREGWHNPCSYCLIGDDSVAEVRHMIEPDWLYLAELSKCPNAENFETKRIPPSLQVNQVMDKKTPYLHYSRLSAQRTL